MEFRDGLIFGLSESRFPVSACDRHSTHHCAQMDAVGIGGTADCAGFGWSVPGAGVAEKVRES